MPDVAKLKKKATEYELKKQFDKALAAYVEILNSYGKKPSEDADLSLYNRVGDLYLKQGSVAEAVDYYEQAVDRYAEGGFFNNAIALCNKILRNSPGRATVYYKLGRISAQKGFKSDAKANFLEYADRMRQEGKIDESFRALKEFADLCPDQDDIRLMLADQLTRSDRGAEAVEQLQLLYERYTQEGRDAEARATVERMKSIDPSSEPRVAADAPRPAVGDLVFLDLGDAGTDVPRGATARRATAGLDVIATGDHAKVRPAAPAPVPPPAEELLPLDMDEPLSAPELLTLDVSLDTEPGPDNIDLDLHEPNALDGMSRTLEFDVSDGVGESNMLSGFETTSADDNLPAGASGSLLDLEPTSYEAPDRAPRETPPLGDDLLDFVMPDSRRSGPREVAPREVLRTPPSSPLSPPSLLDLPMLDAGGDDQFEEPSIGGDLELFMPEDEVDAQDVAAARQRTPVTSAIDIPLMDFDLPLPGEAAAAIDGEPSGRIVVPAVPEFEMVDVLDVVDLSAPDAIADVDPVFEVSPAELELRAELELEVPAADEPELIADIDDYEREFTGDFEAVPPAPRNSTMIAAQSVELLQATADGDPEDHALRRRLGEAMLESGDREGGMKELEAAMIGFERNDELSAAAAVADEIVLLNPDSVRHHQKRVEYAFRMNERGRLTEAYLQLADALFRAGLVDKSRAIYQRVLDLAPDDLRALSALESFREEEPVVVAPPLERAPSVAASPRAPRPTPARADDEFVNLGDWLRDDEAPKDTRMIVEEKEPTGDEQADFNDMLRKFKQGIAENVEEEDHQSHYDLGVAYKEMGLLDEAIAEFQKALRAPVNRVPTYEALGQCFIEKQQYPMGATILQRALHEKDVSEEQLVGVLYLLGLCAEQRGQREQAVEYYQRVFVLDIQFRDIGDRLSAVEGAA